MTDTRQLKPAEFCGWLLQAMRVSEERRRRRKRDTTSDALGMDLKRDLLRGALEADVDPDEFASWLLERALKQLVDGPARAVAGEILAEYQEAANNPGYRAWLALGAPTGAVLPSN